jgi:hypothetical protein
MESLKERNLKEQLDRMFGTRQSASEIKNALFLSQTGKITDDMIEAYKKQKEQEYEEIKKQFPVLNPDYALDYPKETESIVLEKEQNVLSNDNVSND